MGRSFKESRHPKRRINKPALDPLTENHRTNVRVAIFDDSDAVIQAYTKRLNGSVTVVTKEPVECVQTAVEIFKIEQPDVVVTDLSLTVGHTEGFDILRAIRDISPATPVALSTAAWCEQSTDELVQAIRRAHFDSVFQKADLHTLRRFVYRSPRP